MKQSIKLLFILLGGIATAQTSFTWSPNDTIIQKTVELLFLNYLFIAFSARFIYGSVKFTMILVVTKVI
jgi:hypothetical protein